MDAVTSTPKKVNVPLFIVPTETNDTRKLYLKLPEHMHEEHKKEYLTTSQSIHYDLRDKDPKSSLPNTMTDLYNASVYGQLTTSLVDNMIIPATHLLDLKAIALDKEVSLC